MARPRPGTALETYMAALAEKRDDPEGFVFDLPHFDGGTVPFDLPTEDIFLQPSRGISPGIMNAGVLLKIATILRTCTSPSFQFGQLDARASASGPLTDALQWAFTGPPHTGWALMPLCKQGAWSLVVVQHGDADTDGCVICYGDGSALINLIYSDIVVLDPQPPSSSDEAMGDYLEDHGRRYTLRPTIVRQFRQQHFERR